MNVPSNAALSLEWHRLLQYAEEEAASETAKTIVGSWLYSEAWAENLLEAQNRQTETLEVLPLLERDGLWGPLTDLADPALALERLARGAVLEVAELALLRRWVYAADSWTQLPRDEIQGELFLNVLQSLADPSEPLGILDKVLTPEGEISERTTPKLASLHQEIRSLRKEINVVLDHLVKSLSTRGILQENFTDVRDGRYVLPVKISYQNDLEGIVYEASASRQTVFVEPREVAALNNRLRLKQNDLIQEIFSILQSTSQKLKPFAHQIQASSEVITYWDAVHARARLGRRYGGKPIHVTEARDFVLKSSAHPLLWWSLAPDKIIRNEIEFGNPTRTLLLTGPNTGGKTVLLKTLGLAGVCARTGFLFPAAETPKVPFFDSFFIDLGDPQSIEQHLSSFSGHIKRFKDILENVTDQSLVLIDELNSATDPEEGAALGRAFLETLMARGAMIVSTTHDPHLKALAQSDTRILNASMAFDESSREPTYVMILGVPGRSRALETAERLGIPKDVLTLAKTYLSQEHLHFETLLTRLESDVAQAALARQEAVSLRDDAERMKKEWLAKTKTATQEMLDVTRQRLKRIFEQAQEEVRISVRKLDELKSRKDIDQTRSTLNQTLTSSSQQIESTLREELPEIALDISKSHSDSIGEPQEFKVGGTVRIPKWKSVGKILAIIGDKAQVSMGGMKMSLPFSEIEAISNTEARKLNPSLNLSMSARRTKLRDASVPDAPPPKIDLRGKRLDEAMSLLEHYLDQSFRSGSHIEVTIVHGLGTGAIRESARQILKNLPYIRAFRDGGPGHGGAGATIVEFERD